MEKAPNEKLIETMFTHYALQFLGGMVSVHTPSTREEFIEGYDAQFVGAGGFFELLLQFKTPYLLSREEGYTFPTKPPQHKRLTGYPANTAFYVAHTFRSFAQLREAQLKATCPADFLRRYVAIEIRRLQSEHPRFKYIAPLGDIAKEVWYRRDPSGGQEYPFPVADDTVWVAGDELLGRFSSGEFGSRVHLRPTDRGRTLTEVSGEDQVLAAWDTPQDRKVPFYMSRSSAEQMAGDETGSNWGTAYRRFFTPPR